jgi:hypothetical protein
MSIKREPIDWRPQLFKERGLPFEADAEQLNPTAKKKEYRLELETDL